MLARCHQRLPLHKNRAQTIRVKVNTKKKLAVVRKPIFLPPLFFSLLQRSFGESESQRAAPKRQLCPRVKESSPNGEREREREGEREREKGSSATSEHIVFPFQSSLSARSDLSRSLPRFTVSVFAGVDHRDIESAECDIAEGTQSWRDL